MICPWGTLTSWWWYIQRTWAPAPDSPTWNTQRDLYSQNQTSDLMEVYKIRQERKTKRDSPHNLSIIDELIKFKQKENQCSYSLVLKNVIFNIKIIYISHFIRCFRADIHKLFDVNIYLKNPWDFTLIISIIN